MTFTIDTELQDVAQRAAHMTTAEGPALSRRQALGLAVGAAALPARASAQPPAGEPVFPPVATEIRSELKRLAPNVYAFVQREAPGMSDFAISNCGLVAGPESLLGIDSTAAPVQAKKFRAAAEAATGKRFSRFVLTHNHPDHTLGLQEFGAVEVIAHEQTRAGMLRQQNMKRPGFWSNPAWSDGTEAFRLVLPSVTFTERMSLYDYGAAGVQLIWPGRAHTLGDASVYLSQEKIIFIGDIGFFEVTPLDNSGFVENWIKVCDDILRMDVDIIVPGHGPVGGKAELQDMKAYLQLLLVQGRKRFDRGLTPGRAAAEIDLGKYARWSDPDRVVNNMTRLWAEFAGKLNPGPSQADLQVARQEYDAIKGGAK